MTTLPHSWKAQSKRWFTKPQDMAAREKAVLAFIADRIQNTAVSPSMDEIRIAFGLRSKGYVHRVIEHLVAEGKLRRLPNRARALEVVGRVPAPREIYFVWDSEAKALVPFEGSK